MDLTTLSTTAALGIGALSGTLFGWGRNALELVERVFRRRFTSTLLVDDSQGEVFYWLLSWCNAHLPKTAHMQALMVYDKITLGPAPGTYFLRCHGARVMLTREELTLGREGDRKMTRLTLTLLGHKRAVLEEIIREGEMLFRPADNSVPVYVSNQNGWTYSERTQPRKLSTVILDEGLAESVLADVRDFLGGEAWYNRLGIPYQRGYCLYGPPGTGKTSFVKAIAGEVGLPLYILNLGDPELTDSVLMSQISGLARSVLVLEDVDTILPGRQVSGDKTRGLTFSGVLNAIDGMASSHGRMIFLTTNHPEFLDAALVRPGRVDVQQLIDNASGTQVARLFRAFFSDGEYDGLADVLTRNITERRISMATVQGVLMLHRHDAQRAHDELILAYENPPSVTIPVLRTRQTASNTESPRKLPMSAPSASPGAHRGSPV